MTQNQPHWDLYRSFLGVLRTGSLSAAAKSLGLTQPTVGRHIETLESDLNLSLFTRSQNGYRPTEAALQLGPFAETLEITAAALLREASGQKEGIAGSVRVTASEIIGSEILPEILTKIKRQYKNLSIELALSNKVENLMDLEADIAIRMVQPTQKALIARKLGETEIALHAHKSYIDYAGLPKTASDLISHSLIGFDKETEFIRSFKKKLAPLARENFSLRSDSDIAQLAAIRAGFGIGFCQTNIAKKNKKLVQVLPSAFQFKLPIWLVMHENLKSSPRCKIVYAALSTGLMDYLR